MTYVVVNLGTTMIKESYRYFYHAKHLADKLNSREAAIALRHERYEPASVYAAYHIDFWRLYIRHQETVINMMSKKPVVQWSDTPHCCDVSQETYWSM